MPVQIVDVRVELSALYATDHAAGLAAVVILGNNFPQMLSYHRRDGQMDLFNAILPILAFAIGVLMERHLSPKKDDCKGCGQRQNHY
jgi:hypothetical protein